MRSDNSPLLWKGEEHPPLEVLREYQEHTLPAPATQEVEQHLIDCDLCTDLLQGMTLSDRSTTRKAVGDLNAQLRSLGNRRRQRRLPLIPLLDWRAAATILVLLCSVGLVVFFIYEQIQRERLAAARKAELAAQAELAMFTSAIPDTLLINEPGYREYSAPATTATPPALVYQKPQKRAQATVREPEPPLAAADATNISESTSQAARGIPGSNLATLPADSISRQSVEKALQGRLAGVAIRDKTAVKASDTNIHRTESLAKAPAPTVVRSTSESVGKAAVEVRNQLKGQVVSEQGEGLPGVSVLVKGTGKGTSTDLNGNFTLPAPADNATLSFNYIGYAQEEVKVNAKTNSVKVELTPDNRSLSEVVVVGYGSATAADAAATPLGGMKEFNAYIRENRRYPAAAQSERVSGRVVVGFTVSAQGTLENIRILKSLHPAVDAEAIRLLKTGPAWKPAIKNGKIVPQEVKVRIRFTPPD